MPARVQQLVLGLGKGKQANISTAGAAFLRLKKLDTTVTTAKPVFENDAAEVGKGHEFISQTFPSHYDVANRLEKYASAEFVTWACAFGLGNVAVTGSGAPYTYTIVPIDPGDHARAARTSRSSSRWPRAAAARSTTCTSAARSRTGRISSRTALAERPRR